MLTRSQPRSSERQELIRLQILASRSVRIKELAHQMGVSEMTIRRELDLLASQGLVERFHGGARVYQLATEEKSYFQRADVNSELKFRIAVEALGLINDGDSVGLDASTTTLALAKMLPMKSVQAIFTGLDAVESVQNSNLSFFVCGGFFHAKARSFVGGAAIDSLLRFHPDKVFFSCNGFTVQNGFTDPNPQEADTKRALVKSGALVIALVDSSKFGQRSFATTAQTDDVDIVITDCIPDREFLQEFEKHDVRVIVAGI